MACSLWLVTAISLLPLAKQTQATKDRSSLVPSEGHSHPETPQACFSAWFLFAACIAFLPLVKDRACVISSHRVYISSSATKWWDYVLHPRAKRLQKSHLCPSPQPEAVVAWKFFAASRGVGQGRGPVTTALSPPQPASVAAWSGILSPFSYEVPEGGMLTWPLPSSPRTS